MPFLHGRPRRGRQVPGTQHRPSKPVQQGECRSGRIAPELSDSESTLGSCRRRGHPNGGDARSSRISACTGMTTGKVACVRDGFTDSRPSGITPSNGFRFVPWKFPFSYGIWNDETGFVAAQSLDPSLPLSHLLCRQRAPGGGPPGRGDHRSLAWTRSRVQCYDIGSGALAGIRCQCRHGCCF